MPTLIANHDEVSAMLPMAECIDVMSEALSALANGGASLPLRTMVQVPNSNDVLATMPAALFAADVIGAKVIGIFPGNDGTEYDPHPGAVLLFDSVHGSLRAIMDAGAITAIRTAAVSAVATKALARTNAGDLAILGSGVQAERHLEAMLLVRTLRRVRVWSRTAANARGFAERMTRRHGVMVEASITPRAAVEGADIICTVTAARAPVLVGEWLAPGAHINAVGASAPTARELDTAAVVRSSLFVDRRDAALREAGDFLIPLREDAVSESHIRGELGEVLAGARTGRSSPDEITLFKSLGLAVEDLAAAQHVYSKAQASGSGSWIELGGSGGH